MVDVLLTHSYHLLYDRKQVRKMQPYPPLGTLYAAALLRRHGLSVALFDTMLENPEAGFAAALKQHRPRLVAIYEDNFNFLSKMCLTRMREVAFGMLEAAKLQHVPVIVNGSDASDHTAQYLLQGFDYVLLGEAEWTLVELVQSLLAEPRRDPEQVKGLAFVRAKSAGVFRTPARPLMKDLDVLPFPARDLIHVERYRQAWRHAHGCFSTNLVASRGCPYRCNWCAKPIYGDYFHLRSAESVAEEIRQLKEDFGVEHLWFADDIFGLKARWVFDFADSVARLNAALPFKMQSRVDLITPATALALKSAGCGEVWMGVESGSQKILDAMEKGIGVEQVPRAREALRQQGIRACYFLQFGYPGENWEDIQKTVHIVRETRPDDIGVSVSYPLPGTKFYERVREQLGEKTNWLDSEDLSMMFQGPYTSEFYRALHDALHAEVENWAPENLRTPTSSFGEVKVSAAARVKADALWARLEELEKTCQNSRPTLLPQLVCSDATANG